MPPFKHSFGQSGAVLVPPLNFAQILPGPLSPSQRLSVLNLPRTGVYRSGHPNKKNFPFIETLNLRSIM